MTTRFFGAPVKRNEDRRLLTGQALFIDDVELPGMLHAAFLRSQVAHARIKRIDVSRALKRPGVVAVYTADDLGAYWQPGPVAGAAAADRRNRLQPAHARCRWPRTRSATSASRSPSSSPRAATSPRTRSTISRSISRPLPAVVDLERALGAGSPHVHDDLGSNIAAHVRQTKGDYRSAAAKADLILKRRFRYEHGISSPIETRGVVAQWNARASQMTIWDTTQAPVFVRNGLAAMLGLGERQVRVIAPFVGGGFGPKIMMFYPEEVDAAVDLDAAQPPGEMDRGPAGAFLRDHP